MPDETAVLPEVATSRECLSSFRRRGWLLKDFLQASVQGILEQRAWPDFCDCVSQNRKEGIQDAAVLCILLLCHELQSSNGRRWASCLANPRALRMLLSAAIELISLHCGLDGEQERLNLFEFEPLQHMNEVGWCIKLLSHAVESLEVEPVRQVIFKAFGLPTWHTLGPSRKESILREHPAFRPMWTKTSAILEKLNAAKLKWKADLADESSLSVFTWDQSSRFFVVFLRKLLRVCEIEDTLRNEVLFVERSLELLSACYSQLAVRRVLRHVCDSFQVLCQLSLTPVCRLCPHFYLRLEELDSFDVEEETGVSLTEYQVKNWRHRVVGKLQRVAFRSLVKSDDLRERIITSPLHVLATREGLEKTLEGATPETLELLLRELKVITEDHLDLLRRKENQPVSEWAGFCKALLIYNLTRTTIWPERIRKSTIFPNEQLIWGEEALYDVSQQTVDLPLAMHRLGVQYLSLRDLFLRNYDLYRTESLYEIRQDLEKAAFLMRPAVNGEGSLEFRGAYKMAASISSFAITSVATPAIGTAVPSSVRGEVLLDHKSTPPDMRKEWDSLRAGDVLFMMTMGLPPGELPSRLTEAHKLQDFASTYAVLAVRACELVDILDEEGQSLGNWTAKENQRMVSIGIRRTLRVLLDPMQYQLDLDAISKGECFDGLYSSFNLMVRRKSETNNFKGILSSLKTLLVGSDLSGLDGTLRDIILGFGSREDSHPLARDGGGQIDFGDTFLSAEHLRASFPYATSIEFDAEAAAMQQPVALRFIPDPSAALPDSSHPLWLYHPKPERVVVSVSGEPYGPSCQRNTVPFTPAQTMAIRASINEGVSLIVGPPGTGKTDAAVQMVSLLLRNKPQERILILARSNQALNDFFTKIVNVGVDERYLLRLGMGEQDLRLAQDELDEGEVTRKEFSKRGRVNHMLELRLRCLSEAARVADALLVRRERVVDCASALKMRDWHVERQIVACREAIAQCLAAAENNPNKLEVVQEVGVDFCANHPWWPSCQRLKALFYSPAAEMPAVEKPSEMGDETQAQSQDGEMEDNDQPEGEHRSTVAKAGDEAGAAREDSPMASADSTIADHAPLEGKSQAAESETIVEISETSSLKEDQVIVSISPETVEVAASTDDMILAEKERVTEGLRAGTMTFHEVFFPFHLLCDSNAFNSDGDEVKAEATAQKELRKIDEIFVGLRECRPFELLRTVADRTEFMVTSHAKIIAMTSTYASLAREELIASDFHYDTLLIEEAGQLLDVETVLATVLQKGKHRKSPLKRLVLLGDHLQLGPIVQNRVLSSHGNFDQSFFARMIRIGIPYVQLDAQGRCRSELADLFRWRYSLPPLQDLPHTQSAEDFKLANRGFAYTHQFINCPEGREVSPLPHFYQNMEEAEYCVALYVYMRLMGCPAQKISILATYNGQKDIIKEKIVKYSKLNASIGVPRKVTTVDRFQGQQDDYVIISLVRTHRMGYMADAARFTVAMSRARLGLYVVGNASLLKTCRTTSQFLEPFWGRPTKLALLPAEATTEPFTRQVAEATCATLVQSSNHLWQIVRSVGCLHLDRLKE